MHLTADELMPYCNDERKKWHSRLIANPLK